MTRHDPNFLLKDMLDRARWLVEAGKERSRGDLDTDRIFRAAVERWVTVIGEAAQRLPPRERDDSPEIPWVEIIGTRHRIVHGYDIVDADVLWAIITTHAPELIRNLTEILRRRGIDPDQLLSGHTEDTTRRRRDEGRDGDTR